MNEISRYDRTAGTWTALGGIGGSCGGETSSAWGMSGNGNHIAGLGWLSCVDAHASEWSDGSGVNDLGTNVANRSSRANAVSNDGAVVAGWQDDTFGSREGAVWINGTSIARTGSQP